MTIDEKQFEEMQRAVASMNGKKSWEARVKKYGKKGALKKLKEYSHSRKAKLDQNKENVL